MGALIALDCGFNTSIEVFLNHNWHRKDSIRVAPSVMELIGVDNADMHSIRRQFLPTLPKLKNGQPGLYAIIYFDPWRTRDATTRAEFRLRCTRDGSPGRSSHAPV